MPVRRTRDVIRVLDDCKCFNFEQKHIFVELLAEWIFRLQFLTTFLLTMCQNNFFLYNFSLFENGSFVSVRETGDIIRVLIGCKCFYFKENHVFGELLAEKAFCWLF